MRNIKLVIEYDGTNYCGWQIQPGINTIQGAIESCLTKIVKKETNVIGAGRTDAGVHALGQVANFRTDSKMTTDQFKAALNSILPKDIIIREVEEVDHKFHARYSAISRTYEYTILNEKTPSAFLRNYAYLVSEPLDFDLMSDACHILLGIHDFSSFASASDPSDSFVRNVTEAKCWIQDNEYRYTGKIIKFKISANAFLRGMVRAIVGTLIEIGKGKIMPNTLKEILEARDRSKAGFNAPAKGLCLVRVDY
ncbi:MAG: tRNA pseudouridine(38-40) synthase TruA [bacterium]